MEIAWNYKQQECLWLDTEMGKFLKEAFDTEIIVPRTYNAIKRHFVFQFHPYSGSMYSWKIKGEVKELELIANEERLVTGIGTAGARDLQEALDNGSAR